MGVIVERELILPERDAILGRGTVESSACFWGYLVMGSTSPYHSFAPTPISFFPSQRLPPSRPRTNAAERYRILDIHRSMLQGSK